MTNQRSIVRGSRSLGIPSTFDIRASSFASREFQYLLDSGVAGKNAAQTVLAQGHHSKFDRLLFENDRRRALVDQFAERIGDFHQLVNPFTAFVTGVVTGVAAFAVEKFAIADVAFGNLKLRQKRVVRLISRATIRTNAAEQALTEYGFECGRN